MKEIDLSKISKGRQSGQDGVQKIQDFLVSTLSQVGISLEGESSAVETVTRQFGRQLDNRFSMLKNVSLPGAAKPVPLILVGPPGVYVINPRGEPGVFRAREDSWVEMDRRSQKYVVGRENLLEKTQDYAHLVENFLREKGFSVTSVQPLLILSNPGAHIESSRPIVRILLIDALDRYVADLAQNQQVISIEENMALVESLSAPPPPPPVEAPVRAPAPKKSPPLSGQMNLPPFLAKLRLTPQQWIIIGVIAFIEVLALVALIVIVVLLA
jgi:hypothetical protein